MPDARWNLLTEPLIGVEERRGGGRSRATLPGVMARLGAGDDIEFTGLQAHQHHAWHAFLTQVAAVALHATGSTDVARSEESWRGLLETIGGGQDAWCLVVEDLQAPAFLQPPVPEKTLAGFKTEARCPDEIDLLVTAKNHDVKATRIGAPRPEHWMFALVTMQTMQGFSGRDNYGISRMNGGFGNRPGIAAAFDDRWTTRFRRDSLVWLEQRPRLIEAFGFADGGLAVLWTRPWDGATSLSLTECDPFYIEVCRRIRLVGSDKSIRGRIASTKKPRIEAKERKGDTGDVWTPVRREDAAALTLGGSGFSYRLMHELLFEGDYQNGAAMQLRAEDGDTPVIVARALVRGQGKTEGVHERILPIPPKARNLFGRPSERERLGKSSKRRVEAASLTRGKVLRPALGQLLPSWDLAKWAQRWLDGFDDQVDAVFFERLFASADMDDAQADEAWVRELVGLAMAVLEDAIQSAPMPQMRRFASIAAAEGMFRALVRKNFPQLTRTQGEQSHDGTVSAT